LQEGAIARGGDDQRRYVKATRKMTRKYKTERSSEAGERKEHNMKETKVYEATAVKQIPLVADKIEWCRESKDRVYLGRDHKDGAVLLCYTTLSTIRHQHHSHGTFSHWGWI
jgi:hypothetical protein